MGELNEWAKKNSPYISLKDGDNVEGVFLGYKEGSYRGQPNIEYTLQVGDDKKILTSGSNKLAVRMDSVPLGSKIRLRRFGAGADTNYEVEMIDRAVEGQPNQPENAWSE